VLIPGRRNPCFGHNPSKSDDFGDKKSLKSGEALRCQETFQNFDVAENDWDGRDR
jgi:hypothetical protein